LNLFPDSVDRTDRIKEVRRLMGITSGVET
jgi:hypothetical protein